MQHTLYKKWSMHGLDFGTVDPTEGLETEKETRWKCWN